MSFDVLVKDYNYTINNDRPDWNSETKKSLRSQFREQPFSLLPIASMLEDGNEETLNSLHRRHIIAWFNLKTEIIKISNLKTEIFQKIADELKKFLSTILKDSENVFNKIKEANSFHKYNKLPNNSKMETTGIQNLKNALISIYNAVGNVFVGFGNENSTLQENDDNGQDMINILKKNENASYTIKIGDKTFSYNYKLSNTTTTEFIQQFCKNTSNIIETFNKLKKIVENEQSSRRRSRSSSSASNQKESKKRKIT